jgi:hypothetical protein
MGYIAHDAIIVTSWSEELIAKAHEQAAKLGLSVSAVAPHYINGGCSFLVAPDGSNEGWAESASFDVLRARFVEWLNAQAYDDGSNPIDYVCIRYGGDFLYHYGRPRVGDFNRHPYSLRGNSHDDE